MTSWSTKTRVGAAGLILLAAASCASAAPGASRKQAKKAPVKTAPPSPAAARVGVDPKGRLLVASAVLKQLHVNPASNGMVCVQFPPPPGPPKVPTDDQGRPVRVKTVDPIPLRVWAPLRQDGSVLVTSAKNTPGIPGAPGTQYTVRAAEGRVVLQRAAVAKAR